MHSQASAAVTLTMAAVCLAACIGGSSAALQLTLTGTGDGAAAYLLPAGDAIGLTCNAGGLPTGGSYSWSRSFGDPLCGSVASGLTSQNLSTSLTTASVSCYQCTYTYTDASVTQSPSSSLLMYPYQNTAPITVDLALVSSANLTCSTAGLSPVLNASAMTIVWTRASTGSTALSGSVSTATASMLVVANSSTAGDQYYCHGVMASQNISGYKTNGIAGALLATFYVDAPRYAEIYPFTQLQYTEGDTVTVTCKVLGYPTPSVTWLREGTPIYPSPVKTASIVGGMNVSFTISSLNAVSDRGAYVCIANSIINGSNYSYWSAARKLHARSKLAPLWPAIGILAQLAAVAIIIGVTEIVQAKRESHAGSKGGTRLDGTKKSSVADANTIINNNGA